MTPRQLYDQVYGWSKYTRQLEAERKELIDFSFLIERKKQNNEVITIEDEEHHKKLRNQIAKDEAILKAICEVLHSEVDRVEAILKNSAETAQISNQK